MTSITWTQLRSGLWVMVQNANSDRISLGIPASINFTYHSFTVIAWVYATSLVTNTIFCRCSALDGWGFYVDVNGALTGYSLNGGAGDVSYSANGAIEINKWYLVALTRNATNCYVFSNGVDVTDHHGVHNNPGDLSALTVYLGNWSSLILGLIGSYTGYRIYDWCVPDDKIRALYSSERRLFGV